MRYISVNVIKSELKDQFGVDMDIYQVIRQCAKAMKLIGAFALTRKIITTKISNYCVTLPRDAYEARGAIRLDVPYNGMQTKIFIEDIIYQPPQTFFEVPDEEVVSIDSLLKDNYIPQLKGPWIDFVDEHPVLKFNEDEVNVAIEYRGLKVDEDNFPMIPEPCQEGCLYYCLFTFYQPLFLTRKIDPNIFKQVEQWKNDKIDQSRADMSFTALTGNERDKVMDIMVSFDRKANGYYS